MQSHTQENTAFWARNLYVGVSFKPWITWVKVCGEEERNAPSNRFPSLQRNNILENYHHKLFIDPLKNVSAGRYYL